MLLSIFIILLAILLLTYLIIKKIKKKNKKCSKYFNEMPGNPHLDIRFGKTVSQDDIKKELIKLLKEFVELSAEYRIKPILFHGGLIGFYFNKKCSPGTMT